MWHMPFKEKPISISKTGVQIKQTRRRKWLLSAPPQGIGHRNIYKADILTESPVPHFFHMVLPAPSTTPKVLEPTVQPPNESCWVTQLCMHILTQLNTLISYQLVLAYKQKMDTTLKQFCRRSFINEQEIIFN